MNIDKKYYQEINDNLTNTIQDTNIDAPNKKVGKVRDAYFLDDKVVMISTDRQSAFDRVLAAIPYKGAVLNSVSAWWFKKKSLSIRVTFQPLEKTLNESEIEKMCADIIGEVGHKVGGILKS